MEIQLLPQTHRMNSLTFKLNKPLLFSSSSRFVPFTSSSSSTTGNNLKLSAAPLKADWLDSLSCPPAEDPTPTNADSTWVIGIDPDLSGALALVKTDSSGCSAQIFDSPYLPVQVGNRVRKRLDARSIVHLVKSLEAPTGTVAYIEQSIPFPKDGKQGWWSGGFGYGLWIGILVASGFSVVPVSSLLWKKEFELTGAGSTKDDSRRVASTLFPSLSDMLKRKKDHGRAEALLIAAYGKGLRMKVDPSLVLESSVHTAIEGWIVLVSGAHEEAQEDDLHNAFGEFGEIKNLHLNLDRRTGFVKGYALIEYEAFEEAKNAISTMDGAELLTQTINASWAFSNGPCTGAFKRKNMRSGRTHRSRSPRRRY